MQNVEWVMGEWVIPLRLLRLLEHLAVLKTKVESDYAAKEKIRIHRQQQKCFVFIGAQKQYFGIQVGQKDPQSAMSL